MLKTELRRTVARAGLMLLVVAIATAQSLACSVPVFRYALEQWQPDAFEVVIFHEGPLTDEQLAVIQKLEPTGLNAKYVGNLFVHKIDLSQPQDASWIKLWEEQNTKTLPWMLVLSPPKFGPPLKVLAGELTAANAALVLSSPKRTEITKRILKGDSVVWAFIESGDKAKDAAAIELLETELARLQKELKLPEIDPNDIQPGQLDDVTESLKIRFSLVRLTRDDAAEKAFLDMLLNTEPDLRDAEFAGQPMAIPIFGRGRALYALIGKGIAQETIEDACVFLTGACQCTVKRQNPGVDLLTDVEWEALVDPTIKVDQSTPTLTGLAGFGAKNPEEHETTRDESGPSGDASGATKPIEDPASAGKVESHVSSPEVKPADRSVGRFAILIVGGLALVVVALSLFFAPR